MFRSVSTVVAVSFISLAGAACATTMTGRKQLNMISDDKMDAMGIAAFTDLVQKGSVEADPATNAYVRCVADAIIAVVPEQYAPKGAEWEVVVFEDPTPNAFALPGAKIGVHTGMLELAQTPDQLAAVIGHEVGHVLLEHGNERMSQALMADGALQLVQRLLFSRAGFIASKVREGKQPSKADIAIAKLNDFRALLEKAN